MGLKPEVNPRVRAYMYMHTDVSRSQTQSKTLHVVTSIKDMAEVEGNNCRFSIHVVWTLYPLIEGSVVQANVSFASIFMEAVVYQ